MTREMAPTPGPRRAPPWLRIALFAASALLLAWCWSRVPSRLAASRQDDFADFYFAARAVAEGTDLYTSHAGRYIYPPLLAALLVPLTTLSLKAATLAWSALNVGAVAGAVWLAAREALRRFGAPRDATALSVVVLATLLLAIEPARWVIELGNSDGLVLLALVLAARWFPRRTLAVGLAIGLAANIKYQSLIALPYALVRRRWKDAASIAACTVALALVPALVMGWDRNLACLRDALGGVARLFGAPGAPPLGIQDVTFHRSVSFTSSAVRLAGAAGFSQIGAPLIVVALGAAGLAGAWAIYARARVPLWSGSAARSPAVTLLEWCGLIVAVLVFSPQTTTRHMILVVPLHAVAATLLLVPGARASRPALLAGVALFQLGTRLPPGGAGFERALDAWRAVGGASWCLVVMFLITLRAGLRVAPADAPIDGPPAPA